MATRTDPVKATVKPVEESSISVVETPVTHAETASKPDKASVNPVEAQVKPVAAPAVSVNTVSSDDLTEHQSIEESQAALLEEADEIAKFIQQSKPGKRDS